MEAGEEPGSEEVARGSQQGRETSIWANLALSSKSPLYRADQSHPREVEGRRRGLTVLYSVTL